MDELEFFIDFTVLYAVSTELFVVFSSKFVTFVLYLIIGLLIFFSDDGFLVFVDFLISVVFYEGFVSLLVLSFYLEELIFDFYLDAVLIEFFYWTCGFVYGFSIIVSNFGCSIFNG